MTFEHEAEVITKVVALVGTEDLHWESDDPMALRCAYDEPATEVTLRHDILGDVIKVKERDTTRHYRAPGCRRGCCWGQGDRACTRGTSGYEAFGNLVDDFGTLSDVEDSIEYGLYARKERLRRCHLRSLQQDNTAQDQDNVRGEPRPPEALELKRAGTVTRVLRSPRAEAANAHTNHGRNGQCMIVCLQSLCYT